jgi:hypothetical protein
MDKQTSADQAHLPLIFEDELYLLGEHQQDGHVIAPVIILAVVKKNDEAKQKEIIQKVVGALGLPESYFELAFYSEDNRKSTLKEYLSAPLEKMLVFDLDARIHFSDFPAHQMAFGEGNKEVLFTWSAADLSVDSESVLARKKESWLAVKKLFNKK